MSVLDTGFDFLCDNATSVKTVYAESVILYFMEICPFITIPLLMTGKKVFTLNVSRVLYCLIKMSVLF